MYWCLDPRADYYYHPDMPTQLRCSLQRQRRAGVDFETAWARATGHLTMDHDRDARFGDFQILAEPSYKALWESAFYRRPCPPVQAMGLLAEAFSPADEPEPLLTRETRKISRRGEVAA